MLVASLLFFCEPLINDLAMRLLIVEDNIDLLDNLFDFLTCRGHEVDTASDGLTGLHLALANIYDVIMLDLVLPGLDGLRVCQGVRDERGKDTPILILTALDTLEYKRRGLEVGANDFVVKPTSMVEVETRLSALVRHSKGGNDQSLMA